MDNASRPLESPPWSRQGAKSNIAARSGLAVKVAVSVALLAYLGSRLEWTTVSARLSSAEPSPLIAALALLIGAVFMAAFRWRLLVQHAEARIPMIVAVQLTFAGLFFGQALPATVGGDVVRGILACRRGLPWRAVVSGIVLDRIAALLGSVALILAGLPWLAAVAGDGNAPLAWAAFASVGLAGIVLCVLCADLVPLPARLSRHRWIAGGLRLSKDVRYGLMSRSGAAALVLSVAIHLTTVAIVLLIGSGLGVPIAVTAALVVVPLAILAAAVPISLNGWGVREGVIVAGFALFGISSGDAFLISVLLGFGVILSVLPGCLTWLSSR